MYVDRYLPSMPYPSITSWASHHVQFCLFVCILLRSPFNTFMLYIGTDRSLLTGYNDRQMADGLGYFTCIIWFSQRHDDSCHDLCWTCRQQRSLLWGHNNRQMGVAWDILHALSDYHKGMVTHVMAYVEPVGSTGWSNRRSHTGSQGIVNMVKMNATELAWTRHEKALSSLGVFSGVNPHSLKAVLNCYMKRFSM